MTSEFAGLETENHATHCLVAHGVHQASMTQHSVAVARLGLGDCDTAERDLVAAHKLDPANRAVSEKLGLVQQRRKLHRADMAKKLSKVSTLNILWYPF